MKKVLFAITAVLAFALVATGCGGGGGGGSDDYEAPVTENGGGAEPASVSNGITGSEVFIAGRTVELYVKWASDHEVTQGEYETYCTYSGNSPSAMEGLGDEYPVYNVSWYDALVYCNKRSIGEGLEPCYTIDGKTDPDEWGDVPTSIDATWDAVICSFSANGYRLPTEAEWEYLARGGNLTNSGQTEYSGSNNASDVAWYNNVSSGQTCEVMTKAPNALGLYDMSGNVWEWCWDRYGDIGVSTPSTGVITGSGRVIRGGCCSSSAGCCTIAYRFGSSYDVYGHTFSIPPYWHYAGFYSLYPEAIRHDDILGFRVVRSVR